MSEHVDPPEPTSERLDQLAAAVAADPADLEARETLWRAVFGLERWAFIARGDDQAPRPFVGELPPGPTLFAFTSLDRARSGALAAGLSPEDAAKVLAVPLPAAIEWAASFTSSGVVGITFDIPVAGYYTPLESLIPMRDHIAGRPS